MCRSLPQQHQLLVQHLEGNNLFPECASTPTQPIAMREKIYRGPKPSIPEFTRADPRQFAQLRLAFDNNILPADATERFKYQVLCDQLRFEEALLIADSYTNSLRPYTDTMTSLIKQYGQPHHLSLQRIAELMDEPNIHSSDMEGFRKFALRVRALVGMLEQLGGDGRAELQCGSHVARRGEDVQIDGISTRRDKRTVKRTTTVLLGATRDGALKETLVETHLTPDTQDKPKSYCPYCCNTLHFLDQCVNFKFLTKEQKTHWIKSNNRCWRCGRRHQVAQCRLKVQCKACKGKHLEALHVVNLCVAASRPVTPTDYELENKSSADVLYLDRRAGCSQVLLKISKVLL